MSNCEHEWTDDGEHLLVCTVCGAQEDHDPKWRDMATAPRDGTMLRLLVEFEEHSTEDVEQAPTMGANNFDHDGEDEWKFAGWCWSHDHFTQGKGEVIGWLPFFDEPRRTPGEQPDAPAVDYMACSAMADLPQVHEALKAFSLNSTEDNAVSLVQTIIEATGSAFIKMTGAEVASGFDRVAWAQGLIEQLPETHEGRNSWLLNYGKPAEGGKS